MVFSTLDWSIILAYLALAFGVGLWMTRKAGRSMESYFTAERKLPWWWLGTSMVATTFAADTPLAITGIVARDGIAGNWFWWSWILTYAFIAAFLARRWRGSRVLTDVELIELRYDGPAAAKLRAFKAIFFAVVINCLILGWVFKAMTKITDPFIQWREILGDGSYQGLLDAWPPALLLDTLDNTLTVGIVFLVVMLYSSLGGIRGVIVTDLFQFALALFTAVAFAAFALDHIGGVEPMMGRLAELYPQKHQHFTDFLPDLGTGLFPVEVFLVFVLVMSWANYFSDGSGYYAQRINTARRPREAEQGMAWFTVANFALRTWPWIIIGLAALVLFPLGEPDRFHSMGSELMQPDGNGQLVEDREMGYPVLMKLLLPSGLLGLTFTSLMAAFMSTVDTHINWGASYLVNDLYRRFYRPKAPQRELVWVSRSAVVLIALLAIVIATQIDSIEAAWKFLTAMASGLGAAHLLRWVWWRVNAWTEIAGMAAALVLSLVLYPAFPEVRSEYLLFYTAAGSIALMLVVTLLTPPVGEAQLRRFIDLTDPPGFWGGRLRSGRGKLARRQTAYWLLLVGTTFGTMWGLGKLLLGGYLEGAFLFTVGLTCAYGLLRTYRNPNKGRKRPMLTVHREEG